MPAWEVRQRDASEAPGAGTAFLSAESKHPLLDVANRLALQQAAQVAAAAKAAEVPEIVAAKAAAPSAADDPLGAAAVNDDPLGAVVATDDVIFIHECPEAAAELQGEIKAAQKDLRRRGLKSLG